MKSKLKRVSRSTLSIVLVMMMLVSTSLVGMFTTTAATVDKDSSVSATISNGSSVGANNFVGGNTIYLKLNDEWSVSPRPAIDVFVGTTHAWVGMYDEDGDGYYSATIPSGQNWTNVIFFNLNNKYTDEEIKAGGNGWIGDDSFQYRTQDCSGEYGKDCFTLKAGVTTNYAEADAGTWSKFTTEVITEQNYAVLGNANGLPGFGLHYPNSKKFVNNKIELTGVKSGQQFLLVGEKTDKYYGWDSNYYINDDISKLTKKEGTGVFQFNNDGDYTITLENNAVPPTISVTKGVVRSDYSLWNKLTNTKLGDFTSGSLTANLNAGTYQLYVKDSDGGCYYNSTGKFEDNTVKLYNYPNSDHTIKYEPSVSGKYTFTWSPFMNGTEKAGELTVTPPSVDPEDATPKFVYRTDELDISIVAYKGRERALNMRATLEGVADAEKYLVYNTQLTSGGTGAKIQNTTTNSPIFLASETGEYIVTTTVKNKANDETVTRIVRIEVVEPSAVEYKVHNITTGVDIPMVETSSGSGVFLSDGTVAKGDKFVVTRTIAGVTTYSDSGSAEYWLKDTVTCCPLVQWSAMGANNKTILNNTSYDITVKYDVSKGQNGFGAVFALIKSVIYAKDGTSVSNDSASTGGTADFGTTTVVTDNTNGDGATIVGATDNLGTFVKKYKILSTGMVKVSTTLKEDKVADYYVHAFVVNGRTYIARSGANNTYYAYIPVEKDSLPVEITPIYYVKDCKTEGKYIKFYVNTNYLKGSDSWGDTIANYAYYYTGETINDKPVALKSDGGYPGQPMLYDNDLQMYYTLIPKYMYKDGKSYPLSGITVNNYFNDIVHRSIGGKTFHRQTFDFNNMKYIAELGSDIVRMGIVPRHSEKSNYDFIASGEPFDPETYESEGHNPFDTFTNINGDDVNIFREKVDENAEVGLYIIASAHYNVKDVGEYATQWTLYDAETKQRIKFGDGVGDDKILPSDLIPRDPDGDGVYDLNDQTTAYKTLKESGKYDNVKVLINNASSKLIDNAYRYDVRWYYASTKDSEATVNVKCQMSENGTDWSEFTSNINNAYIDYEDKRDTELTVNVGSTVEITANAPQGYIFTGFGTVDNEGNNFTPIDSGKTITPEIAFNMNYVARFVRVQEGSIIVSHKKYDGTGAQGGSGLYRVEVKLLDADGVVQETHTGTGTGANGQTIEDLKVTSKQAEDGYQLQITLTTITSGQNTFRYWYQATEEDIQIIGDSDKGMSWTHGGTIEENIEDPTGKSGTLAYTFTAPLSNYFSYADHQLKRNALRFYSDIYPVTKDYTITYKYKDRFGNPKSFVAKGTHNDDYYDKNDQSWTPNEKLVKDNAPAIDDLYKDCTWLIESRSEDGTAVTVSAQQDYKPLSVYIHNEEDAVEIPQDIKFNDLVYKDAEKEIFYSVPQTITVPGTDGENVVKKFQYWAVIGTEKGKDIEGPFTEENIGDYHIFAKCFSTKFNIRITNHCVIVPIYSNEPLDDVAFISEAQYSREQYTSNGKYYDYIYADFIVSYMEKSGILLNTAEGYSSGIILEYDKDQLLKKENQLGATLNESEKEKFANEVTLTGDQIKNFVGSNDTTGVLSSRGLLNFTINDSKYNNKNTLDYYLRFNNTNDKYRRYIYRAYYYVINADGEITVSEPVYFYLYDIGNSVDVNNQNPSV